MMDNSQLVSSVFKRLFFCMEEPLVPFALYDQAVLAAAMDQEAANAANTTTNAANTTNTTTTATVSGSNACKKVREAMPECNGAVFEMLLELFATYLEHPGNGLDAHGFAVCIAPSLLRW